MTALADDLESVDVLVIDGSNLIWRASYANAGLGYQTDEGFQPTGGVFGFFESSFSVLDKLRDDVQVWVTWEGGRSRAPRRAVLPDYKVREPDEQRAKLAQLVGVQAAILRGLLRYTSFVQAAADGWEGDDAMATITAASRRSGLNVLMFSGDADMLQILADDEPRVAQFKPTTSKGNPDPFWTAARLLEEWGVTPEQVPHVKALSGDASDCYIGVPGIGEGWARKLVAAYGTVEGCIAEARSTGKVLGSAKKAEAILAHETSVRACLDVARVRDNVRLTLTPGTSDAAELRRAFARLRFHSINNPKKVQRLTS